MVSSRHPLPTLVARQGFFRPKRHPVSGYRHGRELALGIGRYSNSINNQWEICMSRLLTAPGGGLSTSGPARQQR